MKLLTENNPKTLKGEDVGYLTFLLHLAPSTLSGRNVCPGASAGCIASCLNTAGQGGIIPIGQTTNVVQEARIARTEWFYEDRPSFMAKLVSEISAGVRKAERLNLVPVFRLNATSDIRWESVPVPVVGGQSYRNIFEAFPRTQFYDYTKLSNRRNIPANYHLTFSRSESNEDKCSEALANGMNVAVVFRKGGPRTKKVYTLEQRLENKRKREIAKAKRGDRPRVRRGPRKIDLSWVPERYFGVPTFHGDDNDLRFRDPSGVVVALIAKGDAKYDRSGFVVDV